MENEIRIFSFLETDIFREELYFTRNKQGFSLSCFLNSFEILKILVFFIEKVYFKKK